MGEQFGQRCDTCRVHDHHQSDVEEWPGKEEYGGDVVQDHADILPLARRRGWHASEVGGWTTSTARSLLIDSWNRHLPIVALPFCVVFPLIVRLVGQMNAQTPVVHGEV